MVRQSDAPTVLLTRPAPQSQRFAAQLAAAMGPVPMLISPLMQAEYLQPALPDRPYRAVILTSVTGVVAAKRISATGQALPHLAFCVGDRTAEEARLAGFEAVSAKGDAGALIEKIRSLCKTGPLLHLHGEHSAGDIAETLSEGGLETDSATAYAQIPCPLTPEAIALLQRWAAVILPIFSPRSAKLLANELPSGTQSPLWIAAISTATADACAPLNATQIVIARSPDAENMLHAVAELFSLPSNA